MKTPHFDIDTLSDVATMEYELMGQLLAQLTEMDEKPRRCPICGEMPGLCIFQLYHEDVVWCPKCNMRPHGIEFGTRDAIAAWNKLVDKIVTAKGKDDFSDMPLFKGGAA